MCSSDLQTLKNGPKEAWSGDPAMVKPDGSLNLCVDCLKVDYNNPEDIKAVNRLIEEGYSMGTHENRQAYEQGLKKFGLTEPQYGSKAPSKKYGGYTDEIAFPQQPTEVINFSAFPWNPTYYMGGPYMDEGGAAGQDTQSYTNMLKDNFMSSVADNMANQFGGAMPVPGGMAQFGLATEQSFDP